MRSTSTISPERQRGFSVPAAIFIVVILAAVGAFMVTVGSGQQLGHAQDVAGSRALQAARAGIEWGIYQVVNTSGDFRAACNSASTTATLPSLVNLSDFTVVVSCTGVSHTEGDPSIGSFQTYRLTATACNNANCPNTTAASWPPLYIERSIVTNVTN